jgi:hypothetical protein
MPSTTRSWTTTPQNPGWPTGVDNRRSTRSPFNSYGNTPITGSATQLRQHCWRGPACPGQFQSRKCGPDPGPLQSATASQAAPHHSFSPPLVRRLALSASFCAERVRCGARGRRYDGGFVMLASRQRSLVVLALLTCLLVFGCGKPAPGVPGGAGNPGNPAAPHSPLNIPPVYRGGGQPLSAVEASLLTGKALPGETQTYDGLIDQCGGTLCVTVKVKQLAGALGPPCTFLHTDPNLGATIQRGATLTIYVVPGPCTTGSSSP